MEENPYTSPKLDSAQEPTARSRAWRFALGGVAVWLILVVALGILAKMVRGLSLRSEVAFALICPAVWLGLMVAMFTRLAFNLFTPQRRKSTAMESIFLVAALAAQIFMLYQMITIRTEG